MESQLTHKPLPYFFIGKQVAAERVNNYLRHKHPVLTSTLGKMDTKHIWYSKKHLTQLLEEIDKIGGDGVRIHLGMYEPAHRFAGQLCLIMLLTRAKLNGSQIVHEHVFVEAQPGFSERMALSRDEGIGQDDPSPFAIKREFNYGSPCPPLCDNDGDGDDGGPQFP